MSNVPAPYNRQASLTLFQTSASPTVGTDLESEFNAIKAGMDARDARAAEIQRDDGQLRNESVHPDALNSAVRALIAANGGANIIGVWDTATNYTIADVVSVDDVGYLCCETHTSDAADFAIDFALHRWISLSTTTMAALLFTQAGAGAVSRTALAKMRDIITPEDFGAEGSPTDDTAAFQAAIDALPTTGGTIHATRDFYTISGTLTNASNKKIRWTGFTRVNSTTAANAGKLPGVIYGARNNGEEFIYADQLRLICNGDTSMIQPGFYLQKNSTVGTDNMGLGKHQWRGTDDAGNQDIDAGRIDSVITDSRELFFSTSINIVPAWRGNEEAIPAASFGGGVVMRGVSSLIAVTPGVAGTGYVALEDVTITGVTSAAEITGTVVTVDGSGGITAVNVDPGSFGFIDGETVNITSVLAGLNATGVAILAPDCFFQGFGTLSVGSAYYLGGEKPLWYDVTTDLTNISVNVCRVPDGVTALSNFGTGTMNVGTAYYLKNVKVFGVSAVAGYPFENQVIAARVGSFTADGTIGILQRLVLVSAAAGNVTLTLPAANALGTSVSQEVIIARTDASMDYTVTVQRAGADTISNRNGTGATSFTILPLGTVRLNGNAAIWYTTGEASERDTWIDRTAATTKNSDTALAADGTLVFNTHANTRYQFRFVVYFAAAATPDLKFDLNHSGTTTYTRYHVKDIVGGAAALTARAVGTAMNTVITVLGAGGQGMIEIEGYLSVGANDGALQFRWAQNTSDAGDTTIEEGSTVWYREV